MVLVFQKIFQDLFYHTVWQMPIILNKNNIGANIQLVQLHKHYAMYLFESVVETT